MSSRTWIIAILAAIGMSLALAPDTDAQVDARLFRYPDVSESRIAFVYAGDIWVMDKAGGVASRLSSPPGEESFPRFSPDGSHIAFSGNYDGNLDIYVVPAVGGTLRRVTYHPDPDRLLDWTPDGSSLLFASRRASATDRFSQLYTVAREGGLPQRLPPAYGEFGSLSPDGKQLAFTPKSREFRTWKRYRGGMAPEIWLLDLDSLEARNLSRSDANDMQPMWHGTTLYFLSDRDPSQRLNIWAVDLDGGSPRQVTRFTDFDVTWPAIGPSDIVFQAGGRLWLLDLATENAREVDVEVVTDLATVRPHRVDVSKQVHSANVSPTGKRAVFEARGDIYTVPAEHGPIRQLTASSGSAERFPAWSPDGATIAYWSDASGEYELVLQPADGSGHARTVTELGPGYRYSLVWSPDSKSLAFMDHSQTIWIFDTETGRLTEVDHHPILLHGGREAFEVSWSSDSRWLAYSRQLEESLLDAVFLFDTASGARHQVTSGAYSDSQPTFDPGGEYLYYLSNRSLEPVYSDVDSTWIYPNTTVVVAAPLRDDVRSPLAPRNDEEGDDEETGDTGEDEPQEKGKGDTEEHGDEKSDEDGKKAPEPVEIDVEGLEARIVVLPAEPGNYGRLRAVEGKVLYSRPPRTGAGEGSSPLLFWDLEEREEETVVDDVDAYELSADGEKLLVGKDGSWAIVDVAPEQSMETVLRTSDLETVLDPRAEWRQMFLDVWRTYRDIFYDPAMHGVDWQEMRDRYGALLDDAVTRWDVNYLIGELIGEVNASHTYIGGGDTESPSRRGVGLLGVDWEVDGGAYRIARILRVPPWDAEARAPLAEPGLGVHEGDYVLAVNGLPLDPTRDPYAPFEGLADETVALRVSGTPSGDDARELLVKTLASEERLRNLDWIEANRRRVEQATGGRVGYIFVPDTGLNGQTELVRQFNGQMRKDGLVIDERFNGGGQIPDRFVELMSRPQVAWIYFRHGMTFTWPPVTHIGPKVMLINGWAGSGGDAFPYIFRALGVGPLIGERTWGGLIGPATRHLLIDGGMYTAPQGRFFNPDGTWFAEGHGVDPDIEVVDDPGAMARGGDPQLEAAIAEVLRLLDEHPPRVPEAPPFERRVPDAN